METVTQKSFGIVITDHPEFVNLPELHNAISSHLAENEKIFVYLIDEGVYFLMPEYWDKFYMHETVVYACGQGSRKYQAPFRDEVIFSGLVTLAQLIKSCSNFVAFQRDDKKGNY